MSNGNEMNVFERLFKLLAKISMMIVDGARDAEEVVRVLQAILEGKRLLVEAALTVEEMVAGWVKFYKDVFGMDVDLSGVKIPERKSGFDRLIIVVPGMTPQRLFDKCKDLFSSWKYTDDNLDKIIKSDRTAKDGAYAIWVRDRVEADEENRNLSANDLAKKNDSGITLEERLVYELKFFDETGNHLDVKNVTLCTGSRDSDGYVPGVDWFLHVRELDVGWYRADSRSGSVRSRSVVSLAA